MVRLFTISLTFLLVSPVDAASVKTSQAKTVSRTSNRRRRFARKAPAPAPTYQLHPDPDRYSQIQRALAERGYFKGEVNGEWKEDSVDALRRFQVDQKIPDDGRIGALSLNSLGLGARHDGSTAGSVPIEQPGPPPTEIPPATDVPPGSEPPP